MISILVYLSGFSLLTADIGPLISSWDFMQTITISVGKFIEMTGMVLLIYTSLNYLDLSYKKLSIIFLDTLRRETNGPS